MPTEHLRPFTVLAARAILPAVCGAFGALAATVVPVYYNSFCGIV